VDTRLEHRIYELMAKAVKTSDPGELESLILELRAAIQQHIDLLRRMAASKLTPSGNGQNLVA
jgi:hypothetical protein